MSIPATGQIVRTSSGGDIVIERAFRAPIGDVWDSIVDPERMNRWIGTWTGEAGTGKRVSFVMSAEGDVPPEEVLIHECVAPRRLDVETHQGGSSWRLAVDLTEFDGITTLVFRQHVNLEDDSNSVGIGWEYYLDRLVATHTGSEFASWDDYYPAQTDHWQRQAELARDSKTP
jgi:uncharacterized protein YndB with AHSA1/START domain